MRRNLFRDWSRRRRTSRAEAGLRQRDKDGAESTRACSSLTCFAPAHWRAPVSRHAAAATVERGACRRIRRARRARSRRGAAHPTGKAVHLDMINPRFLNAEDDTTRPDRDRRRRRNPRSATEIAVMRGDVVDTPISRPPRLRRRHQPDASLLGQIPFSGFLSAISAT